MPDPDPYPERYLLAEDIVLLNGVLDTALYQSLRYHGLGYDHLRENTLDEVERVRDMADEILEQERDETDSTGDAS